MADKKSSDSRRKILKSIAAGSGAIVAGKSLPESWSKPVVDSVMLPVHAQTSPAEPPVEPPTTTFTQTQGYDFPLDTQFPPNGNQIPDQVFTYNLGGVVPNGDGTVTITNLAGDLGDGAIEQWEILVGATSVGFTNNAPSDCQAAPDSVFNVTQAQLQAAVSGGNIEITAVNGGDIQSFCDTNTMDVTLSFPAI